MDEPGGYQAELTESEKDKYHSVSEPTWNVYKLTSERRMMAYKGWHGGKEGIASCYSTHTQFQICWSSKFEIFTPCSDYRQQQYITYFEIAKGSFQMSYPKKQIS